MSATKTAPKTTAKSAKEKAAAKPKKGQKKKA